MFLMRIVDGDLAGIGESFKPKWSATIQSVGVYNEPYKGTVLITRHPQSGTVYTYVMNGKTIEVNKARSENRKKILRDYLSGNEFKIEQADYCINPNGNQDSSIRADVRLKSGARNASGVEVMSDADNLCVEAN